MRCVKCGLNRGTIRVTEVTEEGWKCKETPYCEDCAAKEAALRPLIREARTEPGRRKHNEV